MLIGIWKSYSELEDSLCLAELTEIVNSARHKDYDNRKFFAAIKGIDLDKESGGMGDRGQKEWEDMKARVFSRGKATDSSDVMSLQGQAATEAGIGIGAGIDFTDGTKATNPFG